MRSYLKSILFIFLLSGAYSFGQNPSDPSNNEFVPKGYKIIFKGSADLNEDSVSDKILVLEVDRSLGDSTLKKLLPELQTYEKRLFLILAGQPGKGYKVAAKSTMAIAQLPGGRDPFKGVICSKGAFTIEHYNADGNKQCSVYASFEWVKKKGDWYLKSYVQSCTTLDPVKGAGEPEVIEKTSDDFGKKSFLKYKYPMRLDLDEWGE